MPFVQVSKEKLDINHFNENAKVVIVGISLESSHPVSGNRIWSKDANFVAFII